MVLGDATKIHQIIMNLCTNAGYAMKKTGGVLTICVKESQLKTADISDRSGISTGPYIRICVEDTGHGMDQATLDKILKPFFTTKPAGEGTGMGLWLASGIIKNMGGFITASSKPQQGAKFEVYLPVYTKSVPQTSSEKGNKPKRLMGNERILFVDDEKTLTRLALEFLSNLGYHVTTFNSAVRALENFKSNHKNFDLIITDMTMPEMTGDQLAEHIRRIKPNIPILLTTGTQNNGGSFEQFDGVLRKPVMIDQMAEAIRKSIDQD